MWISKLKDAQAKWKELLEVQDKQEKTENNFPVDNRKLNDENIDYRDMDTDSDSEESSSERNSNYRSIALHEESMDAQQTNPGNTDVDGSSKYKRHINSDKHDNDINSDSEPINEVNKRPTQNAPRRTVSRLTSAI